MRAIVTYRGDAAEVLRRSLSPEAGREIPRTRVDVSGEEGLVRVRVEADATPSLRAALNSYLRWMDVAMQAMEAGRT